MGQLWRWYLRQSFMAKMTAGFVLGAMAGAALGTGAQLFDPLGQLFLHLLKMVVIPLVLFSLMVAVNHSDPKELGRIGLKTFPFYLLSTAIAVGLGIVLAKLTNPGLGLQLPNLAEKINVPARPSFIDTLLDMVPSNIVQAFAVGDILAVVFVALVAGLAVLFLRHSSNSQEHQWGNELFTLIEAGNALVNKILSGVLHYAPIGVFGITAATIGSQGLGTVLALGTFIATAYLGVGILLALVFPIMLKLSGVKVIAFYRNIKEALLTAFITSSSLGTLPITIKAAGEAGISEQVAKLTLPIGATVNMNGTAIRFGVAVIFAAQIVGISLGISELASIVIISTMAAVGTAGVPGAGLIGMSIVFAQANLPIEIVALTAGINVLVDMVFTLGNVAGDLVGAKIVDQSERRSNHA